MKDINVSVTSGPTVFNADTLTPFRYLTIGVKYCPEDSGDTTEKELLDEMLIRIKNEILKDTEREKDKQLGIETPGNEEYGTIGIISLTDKFFEYLKNNETKIQAIRVSLNDYDQDHREQKLRTLKTKQMVVTADDESLEEIFDTIVKELYYQFGDKIIDLYSVILTPKLYKIINNIPVEYRGVLIRVKK